MTRSDAAKQPTGQFGTWAVVQTAYVSLVEHEWLFIAGIGGGELFPDRGRDRFSELGDPDAQTAAVALAVTAVVAVL